MKLLKLIDSCRRAVSVRTRFIPSRASRICTRSRGQQNKPISLFLYSQQTTTRPSIFYFLENAFLQKNSEKKGGHYLERDPRRPPEAY